MDLYVNRIVCNLYKWSLTLVMKYLFWNVCITCIKHPFYLLWWGVILIWATLFFLQNSVIPEIHTDCRYMSQVYGLSNTIKIDHVDTDHSSTCSMSLRKDFQPTRVSIHYNQPHIAFERCLKSMWMHSQALTNGWSKN